MYAFVSLLIFKLFLHILYICDVCDIFHSRFLRKSILLTDSTKSQCRPSFPMDLLANSVNLDRRQNNFPLKSKHVLPKEFN